ncbi:uncharacterized protein LOC132753517 isoform X1 [Ruditapes philippinarum]|uniref:uncharacterized protein LOC132753517 isoform X1 n=2 Tax=Ruditapes philippinarum TaxID=129788 RepID=UPI00295A7B57|nr:uncharacterized protein LOC132753517 isoform X1 [Ruditapes philippinarum]
MCLKDLGKGRIKTNMARLMLLFICVAIFSIAYGNDVKQRLQRIPPPVPFFNEDASLGRWFVQARLAGCGYSSSDTISDFSQLLSREGSGALISYETWRNGGLCNTLASRFIRQNVPGVYTVKDPIGALWSGTVINVAIDYKRFKILYGCVKMSVVGNLCDDPFLNVYTRMPMPNPGTLSVIDSALRNIFGISLASLPRTPHGMKCPMNGIRGGMMEKKGK